MIAKLYLDDLELAIIKGRYEHKPPGVIADGLYLSRSEYYRRWNTIIQKLYAAAFAAKILEDEKNE